MKARQPNEPGRAVEPTVPQFSIEPGAEEVNAWEEVESGRFMPRRIRGSFKGRALG
jgi:hypothetical protein